MAEETPEGQEASGETTENQTTRAKADNKEGFYQRKFEKLQSEHENLKRERMSSEERTKAERDEAIARADKAEAERKKDRVERALEKAALKAGAHDLEAVVKLADHSKLDVSDDGDVLGVEQALKDLQKSRSYLFGPPPRQTTGSGGGRTGGGGSDKASASRRMNDYIRYQAKK